MLEKLLSAGNDEHSSLKFFFGGDNTNFKNILIKLDLKKSLHIKSGDIYFDGFNPGDTIYDFLKMQQSDEKANIDFDFYCNKSYSNYFKDYLSNIDGETNANLDLLTDTKYLFYRFNNILLNDSIALIKIKHSEKIKDKVSISEIEKTDWQYFITRLLEFIWSSVIGDDEFNQDEMKSTHNYKKKLVQIQKNL